MTGRKKREVKKEHGNQNPQTKTRGFSSPMDLIPPDGPGRSEDITLQSTAMSTVWTEGFRVFRTGIAVAARQATVLAAASGLLLSLLTEHADDVVEGLFHVDAVLRGRFDEFTA